MAAALKGCSREVVSCAIEKREGQMRSDGIRQTPAPAWWPLWERLRL